MSNGMRPMETLREAIARLEKQGYERAFRPRSDGRLEFARDEVIDPESLRVDEVVRFEGQSDPEDQAVLLALSSPDGRIRGTFVATYGPAMDAACVAVMERLTPQLTEGRPSRSAS